MKTGDIVLIPNEWVALNPWMKTLFGEGGVGLIVKDYGDNNHHVWVLIGGKVIETSKTKLELLCK